jgi:hypothetical protein
LPSAFAIISDHPDPIGARLAAFFVHYNLERDTLAVVQFISVCDVVRMHKNVSAASAVRTDESEPAIIVESHNYA